MNGTPKKLPTRKCMGCGEHFPKNSLKRILRTPEGSVILDPTGKLSGRGAYICGSKECLKRVRKSARLERSLECRIPEEIYDRLEEELDR